MLSKIGEITKLALIPAATLYFLGFLCVTAYLSRFGIVNFDVLNARYLIAGFFPLLGIAASIAICIFFRERLISLELISLANSGKRHLGYIVFLVAVQMVSSALNSVFSFGQYKVPDELETIQQAALGRFDIPGRLIENLPFDSTSDIISVTKVALHLTAYACVLAFAIWGVLRLFARFSRGKAQAKPAVALASNGAGHSGTEQLTRITGLRMTVIILVESAFWSLGIALFFYSQRRLRASLFDFGSFDRPHELTFGLTFSWFFVLVTVVFLIVMLLPRNLSKSFDTDELRKLIHPNSIWNLGFLVILPLLGSSFAFGAAIFPRVPFAIGGGEPREALIKTTSTVPNNDSDRFFLLGESSQFLYAVIIGNGEARALQINKDAVEYIETRKRSLIPEHLGPPW